MKAIELNIVCEGTDRDHRAAVLNELLDVASSYGTTTDGRGLSVELIAMPSELPQVPGRENHWPLARFVGPDALIDKLKIDHENG